MGIKWTVCYCGSHRFYRPVANQNWPCSSSQMNIWNCKTKAVFFRGTKDERTKDRNWSENIDTYQPRHNATPTFFLCIKNAPVLGARPTHHQNTPNRVCSASQERPWVYWIFFYKNPHKEVTVSIVVFSTAFFPSAKLRDILTTVWSNTKVMPGQFSTCIFNGAQTA
jgi:hypothetical protein